MAMRNAQTNDVWRHLFKDKKRLIQNVAVTYRETDGGPSLTFTINSPISLMCGENGVGKSRALRALHQALGGKLNTADFRPKIGPVAPAVLEVRAKLHRLEQNGHIGDSFEIADVNSFSNVLTDESGASKVFWFDPTLQVPYLLHLIRHDSSWSDLWEGVSPKKLNLDALSDVSALVGRTYEAISIFEITDYQNHEVVPYFRATCSGLTYGAEDMGLGELSLLLLYWLLGRISDGAVLLLEEPETFIAPKSQRTLIDMVALKAEEKKLFVVATSHSGIIAERIPNTHIDLVSRMGPAVTFLNSPPKNILVDRLALIPPKSLVVLVEDKAGALFTKALLEAGNSKYVSHCAIMVAGSESEICKVLKAVNPYEPIIVKFVGVFDGDQRNNRPDVGNWPAMFLPGDTNPEQVARTFIDSNRDTISTVFNRPTNVVATALASVDGQNHHDWLVNLCAMITLSQEEMFRQIALGMARDRAEEVNAFIQQLERVAANA